MMKSSVGRSEYEVVIIGAGPAGLSAAANAATHDLSHLLIERKEMGNTIYEYQLRKYVMAEPQALPLRSQVKFGAGTREDVLAHWNEALQKCKVNSLRAEVTKIEKNDDGFIVTHSTGKLTAKNIVLSIGVQGTPNKLQVPGADLPHVTYTLSDPDAFKNQNILVIGAGDAAIENALALCDKNKVSILNLSDDFPRAKEANSAKILSTIQSGKMRMFAHSKISKIEPKKCTIQTPQGDVEVPVDHIIARIGGTLPRKFLEASGIVFPSADPTAVPTVSRHYESNVPGLYLVGALIGYPLIKQAMNQGHEAIEYILGNPMEPADQPLIEERLKHLGGDAEEWLLKIKEALPHFHDLSEAQFRELVIESKIHVCDLGHQVFVRNDYTDTFFSIVEGAVEIESAEGRSIQIEKSAFFGEMGLLSGRRRSASVRVSKKAILLESPRKQLLKLMKSVASLKRILDEVFILRAIQTSLFPGVESKFLQALVSKATLKSYRKGEVLFKEGELGDCLYFIRKGSIKISQKDPHGLDLTRTYVSAGNIVGEMALLTEEDTARSATASAAVACDLVLIQKTDFQTLLKISDQVRQKILDIARERQIQNLRATSDAAQGALLDFMMAEGVTDADNILVIDSNLCIGCDNCEKACASTHGGNSRLDRKGGKSFARIQIPISCRHCENPLCMTDCPPDALRRQPNGEVKILDSCIGCGNCERNCPYGVIQMVHDHPQESFSIFNFFHRAFGKRKEIEVEGPAKAVKCDLCHTLPGGPACVRSCPTGAALRVNPKQLMALVKEGETAR